MTADLELLAAMSATTTGEDRTVAVVRGPVAVTSTPVVHSAGRSIVIVRDPEDDDHDDLAPGWWTFDLEDGEMPFVSWWVNGHAIREHAEVLAAEITDTRPDITLWDTVACIVEQAEQPTQGEQR